jgi:hypothetical protein
MKISLGIFLFICLYSCPSISCAQNSATANVAVTIVEPVGISFLSSTNNSPTSKSSNFSDIIIEIQDKSAGYVDQEILMVSSKNVLYDIIVSQHPTKFTNGSNQLSLNDLQLRINSTHVNTIILNAKFEYDGYEGHGHYESDQNLTLTMNYN